MVVDPRYTEGIWYDPEGIEFCRIEQKPQGAMLLTPKHGDVYHEWSDNEAASRELGYFHKVPERTVENPGTVLSEILDTIEEGRRLRETQRLSLDYIRRQVGISVNK